MDITVDGEAAQAHKQHDDVTLPCAMMCAKLTKNVFDTDTCQCVDPAEELDADGCMPERLSFSG
jgi:hypothetical protein